MKCQWIGNQDPRHQKVKFCGQPSLPGQSYCAEHYSRVYTVAPAHRKVTLQKAAERKQTHELKKYS